MEGFRVAADALTGAARVVAEVATGIRTVDVTDPVTMLAAAMPGGFTASAAGDLAGQWARTSAALSDTVARHADNVAASAAEYQAVDAAASYRIGALYPGGR